MKKLIFLVLIIVLLGLSVGVSSSNAYTELNVDIKDNCIGHSSKILVSFLSPENIKAGTNILLEFDGARVNENKDLLGNITINGEVLSGVSSRGNYSLSLITTLDITQGDMINIEVNKGVFINPSDERWYKINLEINGKEYFRYCHIIDGNNIINNVNLKLLDNGFEVKFNVGQNGGLLPYTIRKGQITIQGISYTFEERVPPGDFIYVRFSPLLSKAIPSSMTFREVWVNGRLTIQDPIITNHFEGTDHEEKVVSIAVPVEVRNEGEIVVVFKGIYQNFVIPSNVSGEAYVRAWTSKETTSIESNRIEVKDSYYVKTIANLTPSVPNGDNGYYISSPTLEFKVDKGVSIEKIQTFFSVNGSDYKIYTSPVSILEGADDIKYYSVGYSGNKVYKEDVQEKIIKVDTKTPVITIDSSLETDRSIYTLKASVTEDNLERISVQLGSIIYYPNKNIIEIPTLLLSKETPLKIVAKDFAGNITIYQGTVKLRN